MRTFIISLKNPSGNIVFQYINKKIKESTFPNLLKLSTRGFYSFFYHKSIYIQHYKNISDCYACTLGVKTVFKSSLILLQVLNRNRNLLASSMEKRSKNYFSKTILQIHMKS